MKENYDRRKFLKASILGVGAFFVNISPLKSFAGNVSADQPAPIISDADLLYAQAKDLFYRKEYVQSASLYRQLIENFPDKYIYYDGFAHVLGAGQKALEIAELYREGLLKNPDNPYFMQRLALRIYDLCMGSRKAEMEFCRKYGDDALFEVAAGLLLQAINIKPENKGFYLSLRDVLRAVEKKNLYLEKKNFPSVVFPEQLEEEIMTATSRYETKWKNSRISQKPVIPEDIDKQLEKIKNRKRRHFYDEREKKEFDKSMNKTRKYCKKHGMESGLKLNNANKVERYAMSVLEEAWNDTDTIGKLRKYYRKEKKYDKIITLNRYLYMKDESPANALALANSLARYGKNAEDFNEAIRLLKPIEAYLDTMNTTYATSCFASSAQAYTKINEANTAKEVLLKGLNHFSNNAGKTYVLLEQYAIISHNAQYKSTGIELLKTLSNKESLAVNEKKRTEKDDPVWTFVDNYLAITAEKELSLPEQLKPLYALLKIQQSNSGDYRKIETEINKIREKLVG